MWIDQRFSDIWRPLKWFKSKEIGVRIEAERRRKAQHDLWMIALKTRRKSFCLFHIMTGDEKWICYDVQKIMVQARNYQHRWQSWIFMTPSSCSIFGEISWCIMSCPDEIITEERYHQQLSRALKQKRPDYAKRHNKMIFQHDSITCYETSQRNIRST